MRCEWSSQARAGKNACRRKDKQRSLGSVQVSARALLVHAQCDYEQAIRLLAWIALPTVSHDKSEYLLVVMDV